MDLTENAWRAGRYTRPHPAAAGGYGGPAQRKTSLREIVEDPGGVGILALDENGCPDGDPVPAMPLQDAAGDPRREARSPARSRLPPPGGS